MEDHEIDAVMRKLKKRGFTTDSVRERCDACGQNGVWIYKILSRTGGRDIKWCLSCQKTRSWRRTSDDQMTEEIGFDLDAFLA